MQLLDALACGSYEQEGEECVDEAGEASTHQTQGNQTGIATVMRVGFAHSGGVFSETAGEFHSRYVSRPRANRDC